MVKVDETKDVTTASKATISDSVNTTASIANSGRVSDAKLINDTLKSMQKISKGKRVKFTCDYAYAALYPNGYETTYQGIPVYLIFDGRTVELPEAIAKFVKSRIENKARSEAEKRRRVAEQPLDNLGRY